MGPRFGVAILLLTFSSSILFTYSIGDMSSLYDGSKLQKLSDTNFIPWRLVSKAVLQERGVWSAIDGAVQRAVESGDADEAELAVDERARRSLLLLVENKFLRIVDSATTAKKAWDALEEHFVLKYQPSKVYLENEFNTLTIKHGESVVAFHKRVIDMVDILELAGVEVKESRVVDRVLGGVSDEDRFSHVVDNMIGDASLSIVTVLERLGKVEARHGAVGKGGDGGVKANVARGEKGKGKKKGCFKCGALDHWKSECPLLAGGESGSACEFCGRGGHDSERCSDRQAFQRLVDRRLIPQGTKGGHDGAFAGLAQVVLPGEAGYDGDTVEAVVDRVRNGYGYETTPY